MLEQGPKRRGGAGTTQASPAASARARLRRARKSPTVTPMSSIFLRVQAACEPCIAPSPLCRARAWQVREGPVQRLHAAGVSAPSSSRSRELAGLYSELCPPSALVAGRLGDAFARQRPSRDSESGKKTAAMESEVFVLGILGIGGPGRVRCFRRHPATVQAMPENMEIKAVRYRNLIMGSGCVLFQKV